MVWIASAAGIVLGVLSRVEETAGPVVGVSTDSTWVLAAFLAGALSARGGLAGAVALTAANLGYYAWVAATEPARSLASVAGPVERWFALGVVTGVVFGALGRVWRSSGEPARVAATVPAAAVLVAEAVPVWGVAAGLVLPVVSARSLRWRLAGAGASCVLASLGAAGALAPLLP